MRPNSDQTQHRQPVVNGVHEPVPPVLLLGARRRRILVGLSVALLACTVVNIAMLFALHARGEPLATAYEHIGLSLTPRLLDGTALDSWNPMAAAYQWQKEHPQEMYWLFFAKHTRFQYPPSALFAMKLVPLPLTPQVREKLGPPSLTAVLLTIAFSIGILLKLAPPPLLPASVFPSAFTLSAALLLVALGVTYYPLTKGHNLGQIQVYLGACVAAALFARVHNYRFVTGMFFGLCCLVKPQYGVVFIWALLRREFKLFTGGLIVFAIGLSFAINQFGPKSYFDYLDVLKILSLHGESYWPNQSVNGLLHKFLHVGESIRWLGHVLPPIHPGIYACTVLSSAVLLAVTLLAPVGRRWAGSPLDLAIVIAGSTMASPIAWEHHYGAFFPIFALAVPLFISSRSGCILLLLSYTAVSVEWLRPDLLLKDSWVGLLTSHIFFGGLLLFALLVVRRARFSAL
jgi:alpha-1,2-mannosyltransferase